jgi:hypothetical protein
LKFGSDFLLPLLRADGDQVLYALAARLQRICRRGSDQDVLWLVRLLRDCLDGEAASAPKVPRRVVFADIPSGLEAKPPAPSEREPNRPDGEADLEWEGKTYVDVRRL